MYGESNKNAKEIEDHSMIYNVGKRLMQLNVMSDSNLMHAQITPCVVLDVFQKHAFFLIISWGKHLFRLPEKEQLTMANQPPLSSFYKNGVKYFLYEARQPFLKTLNNVQYNFNKDRL